MRPRSVAPDVELFPARTPTLPPATHTNSYAIGAREVILVEPATPYEDEQRAWLEWARGIASANRKIVGIFLTHHHPDHVGGVQIFSRELGVPTIAHIETAHRLPRMQFDRIDQILDEDDEIDLAGPTPSKWRVLHTPGHAPGHLCLFEETSRTMIVGDMVASVGTILIEPNDGDMAVYLEQLERLAALDGSVALPAHGEPIDEPSALFRKYVAHRLMREEKVLAALVEKGAAPSADLVPIAYADTPPFLWPIARMSLDAHLIKLERDKRARRTDTGWAAVPAATGPATDEAR